MGKHTPGPWRAVGFHGDKTWLHVQADYDGEVHEICDLDEPAGGRSPRLKEADARLIAAAPEMYDALLGVLPFLDAATGDDDAIREQYERIEDVLAKAEGGK